MKIDWVIPAVVGTVIGIVLGVALILYYYSVIVLGAPHGF